jgi:hypothetical protein
MEPTAFLALIDDGLELLTSLGGPASSDSARRFMLTIALQESGPKLDARYQGSPNTSPGPARGWWQFEQGGGVNGVLTHASSRTLAQLVCEKLAVVPQAAAVWRALEGSDLLSVSFARLLIFTDPAPVPSADVAAWDYYARVWRPGKPHPETWSGNWQTASDAIIANL